MKNCRHDKACTAHSLARFVQNLKVDKNDRTRIVLRYSRGWALVLEITYVKLPGEKPRLRVKIDAINLTIINISLPFRSFPTGLITTFENNSLYDVAQTSKRTPDTKYTFLHEREPLCLFSFLDSVVINQPRGLIVNHFEKTEATSRDVRSLGKKRKNIDTNSIFRNCSSLLTAGFRIFVTFSLVT